MYSYRIFVSYSHEDRELAERVVEVLANMGLEPVCDKNIRPGMPFTDAIKSLISHAHIFMPLITENSQNRPWVHQETGFAMALNIPVLPVAVGNLPGEMIYMLQAITVSSDLHELMEYLTEVNIQRVVFPPPAAPYTGVEVADFPEKRTDLLARYANWVADLGKRVILRQRGSLSSFHIPDKDPGDPIWEKRDSTPPRTHYYRQLQREERRALELHARNCSCFLIIDPTIDFSSNGPAATRTRLSILLEFLESMPDDKLKVVRSPKAREGNLTIVGDWFVAESMVPRSEGYRQTIFSWHAPTVLSWINKFDQEFRELYTDSKLEENASRKAAIDAIKAIIARLK